MVGSRVVGWWGSRSRGGKVGVVGVKEVGGVGSSG